MKLKSNSKLRQVLTYLIVGGWNTVFGVGLYSLLYWLLGDHINYFALLIPCNIIAITNAYICYKLFVFRTHGNWLKEYLRFYIIYGSSMLISIALFAIFVQLLNIHPVMANILSTLITIIFSFIGHRQISFGTKEREPAKQD